MSKRPPNLSSPKPASSGHQALERAIFALRMQRPNEAEHLAAGVLKSDRGNASAAHVLGSALLMQNRADEAIVALERAARRSDDPALKILLARALTAVGRSSESLDKLREATTRRPPFAPAFLEHGGQLSRIGRFDEAVDVLERGLALVPDAVDLRMELGFVHLKRNDRVASRAFFLAVLAAAPDRYDVLPALGKVMALDGEYAAAVDLFRRALALRPDDAVTRNNLGTCLLELGERDAGEAILRETVHGAPQMASQAVTSLAAASHGRFFLRPSAAARFIGVEKI